MRKIIAYPIIIVCCIVIIIGWYFYWFNPVTTVILVRHAEINSGQNPSLTVQGHQRAGALAHAVGPAGVNVIFTSEFLRTQQTADSAATQLGLTPVVLPAASVDELVNQIKSDHQGEVVLIVGHSNTVPEIIEALGVSSPPTIADTEFDNLFIVHRHRFGQTKLTHLKYGE